MTLERCHIEALAHRHPGIVLHFADGDTRCVQLELEESIWPTIAELGEDGTAGGLTAISANVIDDAGLPLIVTVSRAGGLTSEWRHGRPVQKPPAVGAVPKALELKLAAALN